MRKSNLEIRDKARIEQICEPPKFAGWGCARTIGRT